MRVHGAKNMTKINLFASQNTVPESNEKYAGAGDQELIIPY
jgi:hypothetical protein